MPPLDPFQYAPGRQVKDPDDSEAVTVVGRIGSEQGPFLIVKPADAPFCALISEGHVRDHFQSVDQEGDAAFRGETVFQTPAMQSQNDDRLARIEDALARLAAAPQPAPPAPAPAPPAPAPVTGVTGATVPDEDEAPPAPAPPPSPDTPPTPLVPGFQTPAAAPPAVAPGPAAPSTPIPGAPVPGADPNPTQQ